MTLPQFFHDGDPYHIETSQWTGFLYDMVLRYEKVRLQRI